MQRENSEGWPPSWQQTSSAIHGLATNEGAWVQAISMSRREFGPLSSRSRPKRCRRAAGILSPLQGLAAHIAIRLNLFYWPMAVLVLAIAVVRLIAMYRSGRRLITSGASNVPVA